MISLGEKLLLVTFGVTWIRTCLSVLYTPWCRFLLWPGHWTLHLPYKEKINSSKIIIFSELKLLAAVRKLTNFWRTQHNIWVWKTCYGYKMELYMKYKKQRVLITYREKVKLRSQVYKKIQRSYLRMSLKKEPSHALTGLSLRFQVAGWIQQVGRESNG